MKHILMVFLALAFVFSGRAFAQDTTNIVNKDSGSKFPMFDTVFAAQNHCPFDFVVWVNTHAGTYTVKGPLPTDDKKSGAYMCQRDADQMDYHPQAAAP